jgi:hypothetical protein
MFPLNDFEVFVKDKATSLHKVACNTDMHADYAAVFHNFLSGTCIEAIQPCLHC